MHFVNTVLDRCIKTQLQDILELFFNTNISAYSLKGTKIIKMFKVLHSLKIN